MLNLLRQTTNIHQSSLIFEKNKILMSVKEQRHSIKKQ